MSDTRKLEVCGECGGTPPRFERVAGERCRDCGDLRNLAAVGDGRNLTEEGKRLLAELKQARSAGATAPNKTPWYEMADELAAGRWLLKNAESLLAALSSPVSAAQVEAKLRSFGKEWGEPEHTLGFVAPDNKDALSNDGFALLARHIASVLAQPTDPKGGTR